MRKRLLAIFVLGAALCFGGTASAQSNLEIANRFITRIEAIANMPTGLEKIQAIEAEVANQNEPIVAVGGQMPAPSPQATAIPAVRPDAIQPVSQTVATPMRPLWQGEEGGYLKTSPPPMASPTQKAIPEYPRPLVSTNPVAPAATVPPAAKPPVVAAPMEKPKTVEQAKIQTPAKPPQTSTLPAHTPTQTAKPAGTVQDDVKVCAMKVPLEKDTQIKGVLYRKGQPLWAIIRESNDGRIVDKYGRPTSEPELVSAPPRGAILVPFKTPQI